MTLAVLEMRLRGSFFVSLKSSAVFYNLGELWGIVPGVAAAIGRRWMDAARFALREVE